ncbi:MAG: ATPase, partial [Patescibacteria group bacterium]
MTEKHAIDGLFEHRITYPDCAAQERLIRLVGLDDHKSRLTKILSLLVHPAGLVEWARKYHPGTDGL